MTDNNENADEMRSPEQRDSHGPADLPTEWEDLPADPDPNRNLDYDLGQWEKINVVDNPDQVIFLPNDEEQLKDDAFIVSDKSAICDLSTRR